MNWKQYFTLTENRKSFFKKSVFWIIFINLLLFNSYYFKGANYTCGKIAYSLNISNQNYNYLKAYKNINLTDFQSKNYSNSENQLNETQNKTIIRKTIDYFYLECDYKTSISELNRLKLIFLQVLNSPITIAIDVLVAYLLSWIYYLYHLHKINSIKPEKQEDKSEEKK